MAFKLALSGLAVASAVLPSPASASASSIASIPIGSSSPPSVSIQQLRTSSLSSDNSEGINLHQLLHDSHGILRISLRDDVNDGYLSQHGERALRNLCDCPTFRPQERDTEEDGTVIITTTTTTFEEALESHPMDLQRIDLPDGTVRRTLATGTVGFPPTDDDVVVGTSSSSRRPYRSGGLELPRWVEDACGDDGYDSFQKLRDAVAEVMDAVVKKLDHEIMKPSGRNGSSDSDANNEAGGDGGQKKNSGGYRRMLRDTTHLEHFHVYTKSVDASEGDVKARQSAKHSGETSTLDYHTDAGFFLAFVPAMDCHSYETDNESFYLKGQTEPLSFEQNDVIIMMGAGAQYWLPPHEQHEHHPFLAASHALRLSPGAHRAWYGKMHLLPSSLTENVGENAPVQKKTERQLQDHVSSPANCNNQTNFFCWNQCLDIPASNREEDGHSLYCLDPAIMATSDSVQDAIAPCGNGYAHGDCVGGWHETDKVVPGYELVYEGKEEVATDVVVIDEKKDDEANEGEDASSSSYLIMPNLSMSIIFISLSMMLGFAREWL